MKIYISVIKYIPQVYMNYKRRSTIGWSIFNIILDFTGGFFSVLQVIVDRIIEGKVVPNLVKFMLGNASMLFDVIFLIQHYVLYTKRHEDEEDTDLSSDTEVIFNPLI